MGELESLGNKTKMISGQQNIIRYLTWLGFSRCDEIRFYKRCYSKNTTYTRNNPIDPKGGNMVMGIAVNKTSGSRQLRIYTESVDRVELWHEMGHIKTEIYRYPEEYFAWKWALDKALECQYNNLRSEMINRIILDIRSYKREHNGQLNDYYKQWQRAYNDHLSQEGKILCKHG